MPRTLFRLTEKIVQNLAAPGFHSDGGGLYLQVSKSGTKSWVFRFTISGRTRDMGLGSFNALSLSDARLRVAELRPLVAKGIDPIEARDKERATTKALAPSRDQTFREFAEGYIDGRAHEWKNAKHAEQWRSTLRTYAYPVIGDLTPDEIDTPHILKVLEPIWQTKRETATRLRGRVEAILAAAAVRGKRPATNPAAWRGHLRESGLARRRPKAKHFEALDYRAMPSFMEQLRQRDSVSAACLEFIILTTARSSEGRGARWIEIDEAARTWTVPAERMKGAREHVVPLSDRAVEILRKMKPLRDLDRSTGLVFPGGKPGRPLSDVAVTKVIRSMGYAAPTVHGFRSSFRDWAGDETDFHRDVAEGALAHAIRDRTEASYRRSTALEKRRKLMVAWAAYCGAVPIDNVVSIGSAA